MDSWVGGALNCFVDSEFHIAVFEVGSGPIGLSVPFTFKALDSQPVQSNVGPDPIVVHDICDFKKNMSWLLNTVCIVCLAWELPNQHIRGFGTQQLRSEEHPKKS